MSRGAVRKRAAPFLFNVWLWGGKLPFNPPCGEAVGRGTAPVGRGGGAAPSRHSPSTLPPPHRCPTGRIIISLTGRLLPFPLSVRFARSRDTLRSRSEERPLGKEGESTCKSR